MFLRPEKISKARDVEPLKYVEYLKDVVHLNDLELMRMLGILMM